MKPRLESIKPSAGLRVVPSLRLALEFWYVLAFTVIVLHPGTMSLSKQTVEQSV